jgi:uncharacterized protein YbjT (DUF2867 family)
MTRSPDRAEGLRALGTEPVVVDVFDAAALREHVVAFRAQAIIHELTDLPDDVALVRARAAANARIRREGTRNLLAAAQAAGARRFLAQSVAWPLPGDAGQAVRDLEEAVLQAGGVVLRYGQFYGPGTYHPHAAPDAPRIHIDAAARRTVEALQAPPGVLEIVD